MFMASSLVRAITSKRELPPRNASQDLESFLWVLIYVVYKNGVDEGGASPANNLNGLAREFNALFSAHSAERLLERRFSFLQPDGHCELFNYARKKSSPGQDLEAVLIHAVVRLDYAMKSMNILDTYEPREARVRRVTGGILPQFTFDHTTILENVLRKEREME